MRLRRALVVLVLVLGAGVPHAGCAGPQGQQQGARMMGWLAAIGVSVGTYFLIKELE
jgi:hypothetical protein